MTYQCEKCGSREQIWNSRDGVTPFMVQCRICENGSMQHVEWNRDIYNPNYEPRVGERYFVDLTEEAYRAFYDKSVAEGRYPKELKFETLWKSVEVGAPNIVTSGYE